MVYKYNAADFVKTSHLGYFISRVHGSMNMLLCPLRYRLLVITIVCASDLQVSVWTLENPSEAGLRFNIQGTAGKLENFTPEVKLNKNRYMLFFKLNNS